MSDPVNILIIDDDLELCQTLQDILELHGYGCVCADSGAQAMELIATASFDAVFCDLNLPDIIGIELMENMRQAGCAASFYMITGDGAIHNAVAAIKRGAADYFIKPLNIDKLLHSLKSSLEMEKTKKSLRESEELLALNCETNMVSNQILQLAMSDISLDSIFQKSIDLMVNISWISLASKVAIFVVDDTRENLLLRAHHGFDQELLQICTTMPYAKCRCSQTAPGEKIQFVRCSDPNLCKCQAWQPGFHHYCVPILIHDELEGVIHLKVPPAHIPQANEGDFLSGVANTLAVIIQRQKTEKLKEELEGQMQQSQRLEAMGTLAGGIAHDFNNILTAIIGFADLSLSMLDKESQPYEFIEQILASGERARDLVQQILSFSRKGALAKQPLIITPILKEVVKLLRASFPANILIYLDYAPHIKPLMADPTQIHQVLMNLCINAFHALQQSGGVIKITIQNITLPSKEFATPAGLSSGQYVTIVVSDDGSGIEPAVLDHIFDPYFTTKEKGKGTGLGLSVVHGIVRDHGGDIVVQSTIGQGSTFIVFLPIIESTVRDIGSNQVMKELPHGTETILLVDDEQEIVLVTKHILKKLGYNVVTRTSSVEALKAFEHDPNKYDLVISDISMPYMTGDILCAKLLVLRQDIPIILCTGFSELIDDEKSQKIGARKLLNKPITKQELAMSVRQVLDGED